MSDSFATLECQSEPCEERIRRPPNAFMIFGQQYRKVLANQFRNLSNKQISKLLGDEWKKMNPSDKQHYHLLARQAYASHLAKYPNYHYNPLEARQRKAERKRKYKTVRICPKSRTNSQPNIIVRPFGGNRTNPWSNPSVSTTTVHYVQPILHNQTASTVIGIKKSFGSSDKSQPIVAPIAHIEHNYSVQSKTENSNEAVTTDYDCEPPIGSIRAATQDNENNFEDQSMDWNAFDLLNTLMPPMDNPTTSVVPIIAPNELVNNHIKTETEELYFTGALTGSLTGDLIGCHDINDNTTHVMVQVSNTGADGDHSDDHSDDRLDIKDINQLAQHFFF